MDIKFDYTLRREGIYFGILRGGGRIVFIKVGLGGDFYGYDGKYLKMALRLRERYGCSVIVASNPHDGRSHTEIDKRVIEEYIAERGIISPELFFFGNSNGGIKGLELTESLKFRKMVLVNMPLMINFHKTKGFIARIPETEIAAVYGEGDPSFPYLPFLKGKFRNLKILSVPGADHNFEGMTEEFIGLGDMVFSNM